MKQQNIKTGKSEILVIDFPSCATDIKTNYQSVDRNMYRVDLFIYTYKGVVESIKVPSGRWKPVGKLTALSEEDWKGIVDSEYFDRGRERLELFVNYSIQLTKTFSDTMSATESGFSLLKANGVVMENDFGEEPVLSDYVFEEHPELVGNPKEYDYEKFESDYKEWEQAQEQVWSPNTHVFIKID